MNPSREKVQLATDAIEAEMRRIGLWQEAPLPEQAYRFTQAFAGDTMSCEQWLQFIFLPRVREIAQSHGRFPSHSEVAVYAMRNFDGMDNTSHLQDLLSGFDEMF